MTIYVIIIEDRHTDVEVLAYTRLEAAIREAKKQATDLCRFPEDYEENDTGAPGWKFYARYSCEGGSVHVVEVEVRA